MSVNRTLPARATVTGGKANLSVINVLCEGLQFVVRIVNVHKISFQHHLYLLRICIIILRRLTPKQRRPWGLASFQGIALQRNCPLHLLHACNQTWTFAPGMSPPLQPSSAQTAHALAAAAILPKTICRNCCRVAENLALIHACSRLLHDRGSKHGGQVGEALPAAWLSNSDPSCHHHHPVASPTTREWSQLVYSTAPCDS